jgi:hypothetical protein
VKAIASEIMAVGEFHGPSEVDLVFSEVSYVRSTNGGRRLFFLNLKKGE